MIIMIILYEWWWWRRKKKRRSRRWWCNNRREIFLLPSSCLFFIKKIEEDIYSNIFRCFFSLLCLVWESLVTDWLERKFFSKTKSQNNRLITGKIASKIIIRFFPSDFGFIPLLFFFFYSFLHTLPVIYYLKK